jgi:hypothetical protein
MREGQKNCPLAKKFLILSKTQFLDEVVGS